MCCAKYIAYYEYKQGDMDQKTTAIAASHKPGFTNVQLIKKKVNKGQN